MRSNSEHGEKHLSGVTSKTNKEMSMNTYEYEAAVGRMSAFFAHEIRNPLTSIIGFTQFLKNDPVITAHPHLGEYMSIILQEANRMETLIQELLSLSKTNLNQDELTVIDVRFVIEKILRMYQLKTDERKIRFTTQIVDQAYITGNGNHFERVLINLIKNADEAMNGVGTIDIKVTIEEKLINICITDSGPGIPDDELIQIFQPFFTTKETGTGLGLPICKSIIESLNGTLHIENVSPNGVKIMIKIPQSQKAKF